MIVKALQPAQSHASSRFSRLAEVALLALAAASVFAVDCLAPRGFGFWSLYVLVIFGAETRLSRRSALTFAILCTLLTFVSVLFSPPGAPLSKVLFNRTLGSCVIWIGWLLFHQLRVVQAALRDSDERHRQLLLQCPEAVLVCVGERIESLNRATLELLGREEKDLVGRSIYDAAPAAACDAFRRLFSASGVAREEAIEFSDASGEPRVLEATIARCDVPVAGVSRLVLRDVTERRRAEEALRESEQRLRRLIGRLPIGAVQRVGETWAFNRAAEQIIGAPSATIADRWNDWMEQSSSRRSANRRTMNLEIPRTDWWVHPDGSKRRVEASRLGEEATECWILRDVTADERLERLLDQTAHLAQVGGWDLDVEAGVLYWTDETYRLLGVTPDSFTPTIESVGRFFSGGSAAQLRAAYKSAMVDGEAFELELQLARSSRSDCWVHVLGRVERDAGRSRRIYGIIRDASEARRVHDKLQQLASVLEASPNHVCVTSRDGKVLYANRAARELCGAAEEEMMGKSFTDFHPEWAAKKILSIGRPLAAGVGSWTGETALHRADGREFPVSQTIVAHKDAFGRIDYFSSVAHDLTDRKLIEETLRAAHKELADSRQLLQSIIDAVPCGVTATDAHGRFLTINQFQSRRWGVVRESAIGRTAAQLAAAARLQIDEGREREVLEKGVSVAFEETTMGADGVERHWWTIQAPLVGGDLGRSICAGVVSVHVDVTEERRARATILQRDHFIRNIAEATPDVIYVYDLIDERIAYVNRRFKELFGFAPEEAPGDPLEHLIHPDDQPRIAELPERWKRAGDEDAFVAEYRLRAAAGDWRWFRLRDRVFERTADGRVAKIIGVAADVTEQRAAQMLAASQSQELQEIANAIHSQVWRLDLQGRAVWHNRAAELASGLSHEQILGQTILTLAPHWDDPALRHEQTLEAARTGAARLGSIESCRINDQTHWVSVDKSPIRNSAGEIVGVLVFLYDVTPLVRVEDALRLQEAQHRALLGACPASLLFFNGDGEVVECRPGVMTESLSDPTILVGRRPTDLFPPDCAALLEDRLRRVSAGEGTQSVEFSTTSPGGVRRFEGTISEYGDGGALLLAYEATERNRVEEALRASEAQARTLAMIAARTDNGVILTDARARIEWVNDGFTRITGYTLEEVVGRKPGEVLQGPQTDRATIEYMRSRLRAGEGFDVEVLNYTKSGRNYWSAVEVQPIRDADGQVTHYMAVESDVTERREFVAQLEERARLAALTAIVCVSLTKDDDRRTMLQRCCEAFVSQLGAHLARLWTTEESTGVLRLQASAGQTDRIDGAHSEIPLGKGKIGEIAAAREALATNSVVDDPQFVDDQWVREQKIVGFAGTPIVVDERVIGVLGIFSKRPISSAAFEAVVSLSDALALGIERKRTEADLRESEEKFRQLAENSGEVIWVMDWRQRTILYANPAYETAWGRSRRRLYEDSTDWLQGIHPDDRSRVEAAFERGAALGRFNEEYRIIRTDGAIRWIWDRGFPIFDGGGGVYRVARLANDVTERKLAQEELHAAKESAEHANRAKSEFLSRVSHELRTPLNAILGFAQLLQMDALTARQSDDVEQIVRGGQHLLGLINEVLDISRIESNRVELTLEPVQVERMMQEAVELVRPIADQRRVQLKLDRRASSGRWIQADRQRIHQVLLNLLSNAVKYNRDSGQVLVSCEPREGRRLRITVRDTGAGIAPEMMGRLFTPFDRLGAETTRVEGSGLGLVLSKRLVEAMDGTFGVESSRGAGSTFFLELNEASSVDDLVECSRS